MIQFSYSLHMLLGEARKGGKQNLQVVKCTTQQFYQLRDISTGCFRRMSQGYIKDGEIEFYTCLYWMDSWMVLKVFYFLENFY